MNLILLAPNQAVSDGRYALNDRQLTHIQQVLKKAQGDTLRVGVLNGAIGDAVFDAQRSEILIQTLNLSAPSALPLTLALALPRPNMLKRTLMNITAMGVKQIHLLNSAKVEKSYWQSPVLQDASLHEYLIEGLEQARDTVLPTIHKHLRFRPFVEDLLPTLIQDRIGLVAHPYDAEPCPVGLTQPSLLAIGPEGGWNEFEMQKWQEAGMRSVHLGERILKVETAVPVLLSRIYPAF